MPEVRSSSGQVYILPKKEDVILKEEKGRILVECTALKGKTNYWRYDNSQVGLDLMLEKETRSLVVSKSNEKRRTDAVNGINRPVSVESKVRKDYKEKRESLSKEQQAKFDKDVAAYIEKRQKELLAA